MEVRGTPSVSIISERFDEAADLQVTRLGLKSIERVKGAPHKPRTEPFPLSLALPVLFLVRSYRANPTTGSRTAGLCLIFAVAHPIQDATDEEMHGKCDDVYDQILASLSAAVEAGVSAQSAKL